MTLVELLIAMAIVAILAAIFLGAQNAALNAARASRTKANIAKIHTLLMQKWDDYKTARINIQFLPPPVGAPPLPGEVRADLMLDALRMTQKLEMPDHWSDILGLQGECGDAVENKMPGTTVVNNLLSGTLTKTLERKSTVTNVTYSAELTYPSLTRIYLRRYNELSTDADFETIQNNQGAELLYLIVIYATGDGEARSLFAEQDIGDTDGDGAKEFLDGWGRPISFIRWPAGFYLSDLMSITYTDSNGNKMPDIDEIVGDYDDDHDPFDHFRRDMPPSTTTTTYTPVLSDAVTPSLINAKKAFLYDQYGAYRLVPLVYSAGPDGKNDLVADTVAIVELDPYAWIYGNDKDLLMGTPNDALDDGEAWLDNIHNQAIEGR